MSSTALKKVIAARSSLILEDQPFFSMLALKMKLVEDPKAKKMWTDTLNIGFNPSWAEEASYDELKARICEIVMHNAHGHGWRMEGRDPRDWNRSADYSLWSILKKSGFALPNDVLYDQQFEGLSVEAIYGRIHIEPPPGQPQPQASPQGGAGSDDRDDQGEPSDQPSEGEQDGEPESDDPPDQQPQDPGSDGEVRPIPQGVDKDEVESDWKQSVLEAAAMAQMQGHLPAGLERLLDRIKNPAIDSKAALRKFVQQTALNDFSWRRPNRRFAAQGMFLPEMRSEQMPAMAIYWDTSGSRDAQQAREECAAECVEVFNECKPKRLYIIYGDAAVQRVDVFEPGDEIVFRPKGGGGTDFRPIFDHIAQGDSFDPKGNPDLIAIDEPIACLIGITDLYGTFPQDEPEDYPVLWYATTKAQAPWGEVILLESAE